MKVHADYHNELIQIAAVAVAMIEDDIHGQTMPNGSWDATTHVLEVVADERRRQEDKWGPQHHTPEVWLTILMEEVGEAAQAALQAGLVKGAEEA